MSIEERSWAHRIAAIEARLDRVEETVRAAMAIISELLDRPETELERRVQTLESRTTDTLGLLTEALKAISELLDRLE
jgi:hypothetical protein